MNLERVSIFYFRQSWSTFQVCLYLKGENKTVDNHVSVFLFNECDWMVKTRFSVSVKDNSLGTVRLLKKKLPCLVLQ